MSIIKDRIELKGKEENISHEVNDIGSLWESSKIMSH